MSSDRLSPRVSVIMQFLLLLLLSPVAVVTSLDGCHSDRDKDHRPRENCTGAGFRDVPVGLDQRTKVSQNEDLND